MAVIEAYVTNLGKYNEGELASALLKFPTTREAVQEVLKQIGIDNIRYEEIFIADYDGDLSELNACLGEYESIDELNHLACLLSELDKSDLEKFEAVVASGEHTSGAGDLINLAENLDCYDFYIGVSDDETLGRIYAEDMEMIDIPENLRNYFDYEAYGRDIIDRQTWEKVQALQKGTRRKKPTVTQEPSVFSGLLKCPECGGNLNFHFNQNNHDIKFFSCQNHNSGYRKCSKTHYIRLDFLEQVVLYEVKRLACFASEYENDFIKAMIGRSAKVAENTALRKQRELDALTARDRELDMLFERLYEDNVAGKIDDARFAKMSKRYEQEQGENAKKIKALRLELKKDESKRMDIDDFLETVRRYTDATTITKRMVAELIDHIEVYHAEKQDGVTNQRVVIYYNCIGAFDVPDRRKIPEADIIMETRKGVALSYAPEQVAV